MRRQLNLRPSRGHPTSAPVPRQGTNNQEKSNEDSKELTFKVLTEYDKRYKQEAMDDTQRVLARQEAAGGPAAQQGPPWLTYRAQAGDNDNGEQTFVTAFVEEKEEKKEADDRQKETLSLAREVDATPRTMCSERLNPPQEREIWRHSPSQRPV